MLIAANDGDRLPLKANRSEPNRIARDEIDNVSRAIKSRSRTPATP